MARLGTSPRTEVRQEGPGTSPVIASRLATGFTLTAAGTQEGAVGNRTVCRMLEDLRVQRRLRVGPPGDVFEQEADRVAAYVLRNGPEAGGMLGSLPSAHSGVVQRQCAQCEEEEEEEETTPRSAQDGDLTATNEPERAVRMREASDEGPATDGPSGVEKRPTGATSATEAGGALLIEDNSDQVATGQMRKSEFLAALREAVCTAVNEGMAGTGRTTEECPWMEHWFSHTAEKDARDVEKTIRKFAPETAGVSAAEEYIPLVVARVRRSVDQWATTGAIGGLPEGITPDIPGLGALGGLAGGFGGMFFKARSGGGRAVSGPQSIREQLGPGGSLPGGVRTRMESAFGQSFSHVRFHADSSAAALSDQLNARAFTVGEHVAFGSGEFQPGTLVGDALLAHELAHVVQQGRASTVSAPMPREDGATKLLEQDADWSAAGAVASIWGNLASGLSNMARQSTPKLRSGLGLQRCATPASAPVAAPTTVPTVSPPSPVPQGQRPIGRILEVHGSAWCDADAGMQWEVRRDKIPSCMAGCYDAHELSHVEFGKAECSKVSAASQEIQKATTDVDRSLAEAKKNPSRDAMSEAEAAAKKLEEATDKLAKAVDAYEKWTKETCKENEGKAYQAGIDACKGAEVQKQCANVKQSDRYTAVMKEWEEFKKDPPNCR